MAVNIISGLTSLGGLGSQHYDKNSKDAEIAEAMGMTIEISNTRTARVQNELGALLEPMQEEVERVDGQPLPFEFYEVYFSKGGLMSNAPDWDSSYSQFTLKKDAMLQVGAFSHDAQEQLDAKNSGINLLARDAKKLEAISRAYLNNYVPSAPFLALFTGSSQLTTIPPVNANGDYTTRFGLLRGENIEKFVPKTAGITTANHYRAKKTATLSRTDLEDAIELIEVYSDYSKQGVMAIAHPSTISKLGELYSAPVNVDKHIIDGIVAKDFMGVLWVESTQMPKDFIMFLDRGVLVDPVILKCVNKDIEQRGLKLLEENFHQPYTASTGADGMKAVIFEQEFVLRMRHKGVLLDIGTPSATGEMDTASETKINNYLKLLQGQYLAK